MIVGDWSLWQRKEAMKRVSLANGDRYFSILLALSEGPHQYKFIVDGVWRHDPAAPTVRNEFGELNNIIEVALPPPRSSPKRPTSKSTRETPSASPPTSACRDSSCWAAGTSGQASAK